MMSHDPDDAPIGVCSDCGAHCMAVWLDVGIGPYEFWGTPAVDVDWRWVSPCCGFEVIEPPEEEDQ